MAADALHPGHNPSYKGEAQSPGRARMNAAQNAFAERMMKKGIPESLNSDRNARHFYDPPEIIQMMFGGREWFYEVGNTGVHRVGLFKGLGWELSPLIAKQDEDGITGVRITARPRRGNSEQLYDMEFMARSLSDEASGPCNQRVVKHRPGIVAANLKTVYAEVIGEHAV